MQLLTRPAVPMKQHGVFPVCKAHRRQKLSTHDTHASCSVAIIIILRDATKNKPLKQLDLPHDGPIRSAVLPQLNITLATLSHSERHQDRAV